MPEQPEIPHPESNDTLNLSALAEGIGWADPEAATRTAGLLEELADIREVLEGFEAREKEIKASLKAEFASAAKAGDPVKVRCSGFTASAYTTRRGTLDQKAVKLALVHEGVSAVLLEEKFEAATKQTETFSFKFAKDKRKK